MASLRSLLVVVALLASAGCLRAVRPDGADALSDALARARASGGSARTLALAGFGAHLVESKPDEARAFLKKARAIDPDDPFVAALEAELARRSLDTRRRAMSALRACRRDPRHPLCAWGGHAALDLVGESPRLDRAIESRALAALAAGAPGDAARALRAAVAQIRRNRGDLDGAHAVLDDAGQVTQATLLGPWSAWHALEWDVAFPPETGDASGGRGPLGMVEPREALAPDGRFALWGELGPADIYTWATDVEVAEAGIYQAHARSSAAMKLIVDGAVVGERRAAEGLYPQRLAGEVELDRGRHRIVVKLARGTERGDLMFALSRADGAPARLKFRPAVGAFSRKPPPVSPGRGSYPDAASLARALEPEAGFALSAYLAARDAMETDDQGARLLSEALAALKPSAPFLVLRAEAALVDRSLPQRTAKGRADRDLEAALALDPKEASALQRLSVQARGDGRYDEAAGLVERAKAAAAKRSWRPLLTEMRLAQARGLDGLADEVARRALALEPGLCDALVARYDNARNLDAVALADALVREAAACPMHARRIAEHLKVRGDLEGAREGYDRLARESPLDPGPQQAAAQVAMGQGRPREAAEILAHVLASWPRLTAARKKRADALEAAGEPRAARAEREAALAVDGSDLKLRRALAVGDGTEVLEHLKEDGAAAIARYRSAAPSEQAAGVYLLDASAVQAHPDGSVTERTHVVAKVVDQRGIGLLAEVHLPAGADVLALRTLKKDGRILEPEDVGDKDGVSLPGVEVGDLVEYEYLSSAGSRGPAVPGFSAPKFYFQIVDGQLFHSIYKVEAPAGSGLEVDAHGTPSPPVVREGGAERVTVERRDMPTFVREPGQPSNDEGMPFVQVGAGAGPLALATSLGDFLVDRSFPTADVERFAREAAGGLAGGAAVEAVFSRVMREVRGQEAALTTRASATLAQGRGSRVNLLKAALRALGVSSRIALARPFSVDPATYRFPNAELYAWPVLVVSLPGSEPLWLDPSVRFAPFGRLSPQIEGAEAIVLPEVGERARLTTTPGAGDRDLKRVSLDLAIAADGTLTGKGEEVHEGFEAASLKAGLEKLDQDGRRQAVEAAVARTFQRASVTDLEIVEDERPGTPVRVRYTFSAPGFARAKGDRIVLPSGLYPASMGRRFVSLAERRLPLLIASPIRQVVEARIALPPGMVAEATAPPSKLEGPFGRFERRESLEAGRVVVAESLEVPMIRVAPERYPAFVEMAAAVDRAQAGEWVLAPAR